MERGRENRLRGGWGPKRVNWARVGRIRREKKDLNGTQVRVSVTGQKYHCLRHKEILDGYHDFSTYLVVGSLKDNTNFGL